MADTNYIGKRHFWRYWDENNSRYSYVCTESATPAYNDPVYEGDYNERADTFHSYPMSSLSVTSDEVKEHPVIGTNKPKFIIPE